MCNLENQLRAKTSNMIRFSLSFLFNDKIVGDFNAFIFYNPVMSVTRSVIKKLCLKQISERRYSVKFATCFSASDHRLA